MKNTQILKLIKELESGRIHHIEFIKKDGSVGSVQGRTGVKKHLRGGVRTSDPAQYLMIYDFKKGYRNVNIDTIIRVDGVEIR